MHSYFKYFFPLWITLNIDVHADDFVYEYFVYKSVPRVTIFSCEQIDDDFRFVRRINDLGISVGVAHPQSEFYNVSDHVLRKDNWVLGLLLDTRCQTREVNEKIIAQTSKYRLYEGIHVWLMITSNFEVTIQLLNDSSYSPLTDLVIAVKTDTGYELHDVYNPNKARGGTLNITRMGFWDPYKGLGVTLTQEKFARRSNLHGMKIKMGSVMKGRPPGMAVEDHLQDDKKKSQDPVSKYGYSIVRHLADLYNFTIEILPATEWIATVNDTEIGLMVQLSNAEVDIIGSPCSANLRFAGYGKLLGPGYPYRTFFLLRSNVAKLKWTELLKPFAVDSWYATGLTAILTIALITMIQMSEYGEGWFDEIGHAIFATIGIICQQGLVFVPNRLSGRMALLFLLIFGVLLLNYYGASVVSARLSEPPDKMNDSLYSLAKSHMKVASEPFRVIDDNLESRGRVEWEVRYFNEKVWKKLSLSRFIEHEKGLGEAAKGGFAYHSSAEVAYPYVDTHWDDKAICDMTEIHVITPRVLYFYETADSPFTEMMKVGLIKTTDMGLQRRTVKHWKPRVPYCSPLARSLQSVTLFEIAPAVMLISLGTAVALLVYLFERILYKLHPTKSTSLKASKVQRTGGKKALLRSLKNDPHPQ